MPLDEKEISRRFTQAVTDTLRVHGLPRDHQPLLDITRIGKGGFGFVLRGYVHLPARGGHERVRWRVVKGPVPYVTDPAGAPSVAPAEPFAVTNEGLVGEHAKREWIGEVPGLGPIPESMNLDGDLVRSRLDRETLDALHVPEQIVILVFDLLDERAGRAPPEDLGRFVRHPVATARDLVNWCEIARALGTALLGLHGRSWIHRDVKLANAVAQMDRGFIRSVELIDLGGAEYFGEGAKDLQHLGRSKVGTDHYHRPARLLASQGGRSAAAWRPKSPVDEDVYAYGSLLARWLLGRLPADVSGLRHPDRPYADEIEERVKARANAAPRPGDPLGDEIGHAFSLVRDLLVQEHEGSVEPISRFLRHVERRRNAALEALAGHRVRAAKGLLLLPELLRSIDAYVADDEEAGWCERYPSTDAAAARREIGLPDGASLDLEACVELLRHGYVGIARTALDGVLRGPSTDPSRDERGLRIYVGLLLLREGDAAKGHAVLDRYDDRIDRAVHRLGLAWWIDMLRARLRFSAGLRPSTAHLDVDGLDERQRAWIHAFAVLSALDRKEPIDAARYEGLLGTVRRASSTPELLFAIMLLARVHVEQAEPVQALRWVHAGLAEAAARRFPIEYTSLLALASTVLKRVDRARLEADRVDADALSEATERLAVHAADLFGRLGASALRDHAIRVAAKCAEARSTFEGVTAAAGWYELAAANATLSGRVDAPRRIDEMKELRERWKGKPRDPGSREAELYYDRYGWVIEKLWGTGGLSIEHVEGGAPRAGAVLEALLREPGLALEPSRVLVVGCGTGSEVSWLAERFPGARVHGIDVSSWSIHQAREKVAPLDYERRCSFLRVDLVADEPIVDSRDTDKGSFQLVVMRETLAHVTFKRSFLKVLRSRVEAGTELRVTDLFQRRPAGPAEWRDVLRCMGLTNLASLDGLCEDFEEAGFEIVGRPVQASDRMLELFADRRAWFERSEAPGARELRAAPTVERRVKRVLDTLIRAVESELLGWVHLSACATPAPQPPLTDRVGPSPLSSFPPPRDPKGVALRVPRG
jgi:2-polyprenyl-3-methyl-5-hydroxy-6-metoxy-1,4-benzoquinol methylase